jgi:glc operon protein GlcG
LLGVLSSINIIANAVSAVYCGAAAAAKPGEETMRRILFASVIAGTALLAAAAVAQQPPTPPMPPTTPYGPPITLDQARKAADAAIAEATKRNQKIAVAIVEPSGALVHFVKMDDTQYASIRISIEKARSAALFRRSSKDFLDRVAKGDLSPMALRGAVASAGGIPIALDGKIIGAIGISGGADDPIAQAGAAAVK